MSSREERIEVFEDTQAWINENEDLSDSVSLGKKHTEIFYENDYPDFDINRKYDTLTA